MENPRLLDGVMSSRFISLRTADSYAAEDGLVMAILWQYNHCITVAPTHSG